MADIAPASLQADLVPVPQQPPLLSRPIARMFPVGVKHGHAILIALCTDGSIWELDRARVVPQWEKMPAIPLTDDDEG